MKASQNSPYSKQLSFDFNKPSPNKPPVIWQWNQLSPNLREVILELAICTNPKTNKILSNKKAQEIEPWMKSTLNWIMELVSKGWVDLRFDEH
jgi:hypothetical protein